MTGLLKISEAASLAFHSMYLLARQPKAKLSILPIAKKLDVSADHLAKVLQRLAAAKLVKSTRGPKGGFELARPASQITLLDIYEAIHGKFQTTRCLLSKPVCSRGCCLLGGLIQKVDREVLEHFKSTRLSYFAI